jgi:glucokinase
VFRQAHRRLLELLTVSPDGLRQDELMAATGLARSSISTLLGDLDDVLEVTADALSPAGRPPRVNRIRADVGVVAGIDIGNHRVHVALADLAGNLLSDEPLRSALAQDSSSGLAERTLDGAAGTIRSELTRLGRPLHELAAVGVSFPGIVSRDGWTTRDPALPQWRDKPIPAFLRARLGERIAVALEHEAAAAMLAERRWGAARDVDDALFVEWSSTISASVMADGRIWHGSNGMVGGLGHVRVPLAPEERTALRLDRAPVGPCPHCDQLECTQQLVGGTRMATLFHVSSVEEGERLLRTDAEVRATALAMARVLGRAIGVGVAIADPRVVIVGGGAPPDVLEAGFEALARGVGETAAPRRPDVQLSKLGEHAAIRGAIAAAMTRGVAPYLLRRLDSFHN